MTNDIISNEALLKTYLSPEMEHYYYKKLPNENKEYVKLKICELLKYLNMTHNAFGDIPFSDEIDETWHLWILQTLQYQELMKKLPGKKFINHCSNDYIDGNRPEIPPEEAVNTQISYLVSYVINFGGFTGNTIKFWPTTQTLMDLMKFDIESLNSFLKSYATSASTHNSIACGSNVHAAIG